MNSIRTVLFTSLFSALFFVQSAQAGIMEIQTKWLSSNVRVCWANVDARQNAFLPTYEADIFNAKTLNDIDGEFSEAQKQSVQKIVNSEFTDAHTGIRFTGWIAYGPNEICDALVFGVQMKTQDTGGDTTLGFKGEITRNGGFASDMRAPGLPLVFLRLKSGADQELGPMALHEFGHLAGLRHEVLTQALPPGVPKLRDCMVEDLGTSAAVLTPYDPGSIMNRCDLFPSSQASGRFKLSVSDRKTLLTIYGGREF